MSEYSPEPITYIDRLWFLFILGLAVLFFIGLLLVILMFSSWMKEGDEKRKREKEKEKRKEC